MGVEKPSDSYKYAKGSEWRKWDLQVHTILDKGYTSIEKYINELKKNFNDKFQELVGIIGEEELIKKYDSKENFFECKEKEKHYNSKKYASLFVKYLDIFHEDVGAICVTEHNYSHSSLIDDLIKESKNTRTQIIPGVEVNIQGVHMLVLFGEIPYEQKTYSKGIQTFLSKIGIDNPKEGNTLTVSEKSYADVLKIIDEIGGLFIYPHCNSENGLFQERGKTDRIHLANYFNYPPFNILQAQKKSSADKTIEYIVSNKSFTSGYVFTLGSDARKLGDILQPDQDGNFTWIKADPTFEGLKQIMHEGNTRVKIQKNKPAPTIQKISRVKINFASDMKIKDDKNQNGDTFCFSGVKKDIYLSDYFTCFIGGRGSGKSTFLKLLYNSVSPPEKRKSLFGDDRKLEIDYTSQIVSDNSAKGIEFLEQNEIEKFATDYSDFSQAIYSRLKDESLETLQSELEREVSHIDNYIRDMKQKQKTLREICETERLSASSKKIVDTIKTQQYTNLQKALQDLNKEHTKLEYSKEKFNKFKTDLNTFIDSHNQNKGDGLNKYELYENQILETLKGVKSDLAREIFEDEEKRKQELETNIAQKQEELEKYLEEQGLSRENLKGISEENKKIEFYGNKLNKLNNKISELDKNIQNTSFKSLEEKKGIYENAIKKGIEQMKKELDEVNQKYPKNIEKIALDIGFDTTRANDELFNEFLGEFKDFIPANLRKENTKEFLFEKNPREILSKKITNDDFKKHIFSGSHTYHKFLQDIFEEEGNMQIYHCLICKHYYNLTKYLKINISYKGRSIEGCSFGQKCTVVIIIMLLFGNNPIIIDEPEAHLDSALIAQYLVELIKKKKQERQIIFATHNANFVINGDAEQIYILNMGDKQTEFTQTSIENMDHRDKLLKLEGGKQAFKQRIEKLKNDI